VELRVPVGGAQQRQLGRVALEHASDDAAVGAEGVGHGAAPGEGLEALALPEPSDGLDHGIQADDRDGEGGGEEGARREARETRGVALSGSDGAGYDRP
jgi:hypothetical protein